MRAWFLLFWVQVLVLVVPEGRACGVLGRLPKDHFDGVNEYGFVSYWEQIGELDLGAGLKFPLVIGFESNRETSSPYLGQGWIFALLDSRVVQTGERDFLMTLPDGYSLSFWRGKAPEILNGQAGWKAEIKGDAITAYAECGWKLTFIKGRLSSMTTPSNRVLDYVFNAGRVVEIREKGATLLKVETDSASGGVSAFSYEGRRIGVELGSRPQIQSIQGRNLVVGMTPSLKKITFPDGVGENFDFSVDQKVQPVLTISGKNSRVIRWDPATKRISADNDWIYSITPSQHGNENAAIGRLTSGGMKEFWLVDSGKGTETVEVNGVKTVTSRFQSGVLEGKKRNVVQYKGGVTATIYKAAYDEAGRPVRLLDGDLNTEYVYTATGRQETVSKSGEILWVKSFDNKGRLHSVKCVGVFETIFSFSSDGRASAKTNFISSNTN